MDQLVCMHVCAVVTVLLALSWPVGRLLRSALGTAAADWRMAHYTASSLEVRRADSATHRFQWTPDMLDRGVNLTQLVEKHAAAYQRASPFPHAVLDGLFPDGLLIALAAEIPENTAGAGSRTSRISSEQQMGGTTRAVVLALRSPPWVRFLERLSGIDGLHPDPGFSEGGVQRTAPGGRLEVHADFNHLGNSPLWHRRMATHVFLNPAWPDAYGGHLELWDSEGKACVQRILPLMGRVVVFTSTDFSFHGHPTPLPAPLHRMRRSLALHYYTRGERDPAECLDGRCDSMHASIVKNTTGGAQCSLQPAAASRSGRAQPPLGRRPAGLGRGTGADEQARHGEAHERDGQRAASS